MPRKKKIPLPEVVTDPVQAAKAAGLRYVTDQAPGIRREHTEEGFAYIGVDGTPVRDEDELQRIRSLAVPPAYREVWICPYANGHLQATGIDARGRKQYRYHPRWREVRDETKYTRMLAFGAQLPRIREKTRAALAKEGLSREKVLATVIQLLEKTLIRVGNEEYSRANKSYGLTTLRNRHVRVDGSHITFVFRGKSGVRHTINLNDRRLSRTIKRLHELPGQELFQYLDENGEPHSITSADVNEYLKEITGEEFTAKDFRTWAGTVLASLALQEYEQFDSQAQAKSNIVRAIETVAERLGNTPSVCRKCYVHPAVIDSYLDGSMIETLRQRADEEAGKSGDLQPEEMAVMRLLQARLAREAG